MSNIVTSEVATSTINAGVAATARPNPTKNASRGQAQQLADVVLESRKSKTAPSKVMSTFAADCASILMDDNDPKRLEAAADRAKKEALLVIENQLQRAKRLSNIPRGTTGSGGIHRDDVVVEVFTADRKSAAVARNTRALRSAGKIS